MRKPAEKSVSLPVTRPVVSLPVSAESDPPSQPGDEPKWYAQGLRFECSQCGNCCSGAPGYVYMTIDEMEKIADYLKLDFDQFTRTYVKRVGNRFSLLEKFNYDCTFLKRENGKALCMIYPVRPVQCRTWPFWNDNLKSPQAWENASHTCPGMCDAKAPHYPLEHIEKKRTTPGSL